MRIFFSILIIVCSGLSSRAAPVSSPPKHPAVVRVVVPESNGTSLGSGALVSVSEEYGLVVTNWHVVRDGSGTATVIFPDGFRSPATVVRVDRDWDLAALLIWRPRVRPIPLAGNRPVIGEPLWIAGYGRGDYRMAGGKCTHYLSPGGRLPFDMIELSAGARQGDSGGPILNQRGELAGVLFGAAWGKTSGSHCMRVKQFLDPVLYRMDSGPRTDGTMLAQRDSHNVTQHNPTTVAISAGRESARMPVNQSVQPQAQYSNMPTAQAVETGNAVSSDDQQTPWVSVSPNRPFAAPPEPSSTMVAESSSEQLVTSDSWEQAKTVLAMIGLVAIFFHFLKWIGK